MKKNLFPLFILLATVIAGVVSAQAKPVVYFFHGTQIQTDTLTDGVVSGTVVCNRNTGTFTLDNAVINITSEDYPVFSDGNYGNAITLIIKGKCSIKVLAGGVGFSASTITVQGNSLADQLEITSRTGLVANGVNIANCVLKISTSGGSLILNDRTTASFSNCQVNLHSNDGRVIEGASGMTFDGCRITSPDPATITLADLGYRMLDGSKFYSMAIDLIKPTDVILFEDALVKSLCVSHWDTNKDGQLSYGEAAAVTSLGDVFQGQTKITKFDELQYFTGLTKVDEGAFKNCTKLEKVTIPKTAVTIEAYAFLNNLKLTRVTFVAGNSLEAIKQSAFYATPVTTITGVDKLTYIGTSAFSNCVSLETFDMPATLNYIGNRAFYGCKKLNTAIPTSVNQILQEAFAYCSSLTTDQHLTNRTYQFKIGKDAFRGCPLHKIVLESDFLMSTSVEDCFYGDNADDFICYVNNHVYNAFQSLNWTAEQKWRMLPYVDLGAHNRAPIYCNIDLIPAKSSYWAHVFEIVSDYDKGSSYVNARYTEVPRTMALPAGTPAIAYSYGADRIYFEHPKAPARPFNVKNLLIGSYAGGYTKENTDQASYYIWNHADDVFKCLSSNSRANRVGSGCAYIGIPEALDSSVYATVMVNGTDPNSHIYDGDVNGDGVVDITDVNILINIILGKTEAEDIEGNADINDDRTIDITDVNIVLNLILGK